MSTTITSGIILHSDQAVLCHADTVIPVRHSSASSPNAIYLSHTQLSPGRVVCYGIMALAAVHSRGTAEANDVCLSTTTTTFADV